MVPKNNIISKFLIGTCDSSDFGKELKFDEKIKDKHALIIYDGQTVFL